MDGTDLPFTKQDFRDLRDAIAAVKNLDDKLDTKFEGINDKIDALTTSVIGCQATCAGRRERIDTRVKSLEEQHKEEKGSIKGRKADIAIVFGVGSFAVTCIAIWRFFFP